MTTGSPPGFAAARPRRPANGLLSDPLCPLAAARWKQGGGGGARWPPRAARLDNQRHPQRGLRSIDTIGLTSSAVERRWVPGRGPLAGRHLQAARATHRDACRTGPRIAGKAGACGSPCPGGRRVTVGLRMDRAAGCPATVGSGLVSGRCWDRRWAVRGCGWRGGRGHGGLRGSVLHSGLGA